jgi:prepilin-type N-terminal cleavage/methylation domain-containing protein
MSSAGPEVKAVRRGVNLVELLLVVIIIGIVASIAIPRASRGSRVPGNPELVNSLAILRTAVEEYAADHEGRFPGTNADRTAGDAALFVGQTTKFTSVTGGVSDIRTSIHRFGPYIRHRIPSVPVGGHRGEWQVAIDIENLMPKVDMTRPAGWIYNPLTGDIIANADGADEDGQLYCNY